MVVILRLYDIDISKYHYHNLFTDYISHPVQGAWRVLPEGLIMLHVLYCFARFTQNDAILLFGWQAFRAQQISWYVAIAADCFVEFGRTFCRIALLPEQKQGVVINPGS